MPADSICKQVFVQHTKMLCTVHEVYRVRLQTDDMCVSLFSDKKVSLLKELFYLLCYLSNESDLSISFGACGGTHYKHKFIIKDCENSPLKIKLFNYISSHIRNKLFRNCNSTVFILEVFENCCNSSSYCKT